MRPICVKCEHELTMEECGVLVAELYQENASIYRLWYADGYRCPICHVEIIHNFADNPFWCAHEIDRLKQRDAAIEQAKKEKKYFESKETL